MKKLIIALSLIISSLSFASTESVVFPDLYVFGNHIQLTVRNYTDRPVTCSGFVFFSTFDGSRVTHHYFDTVPAYFTAFRNIYPRSMNDRILNARHTISCF